MGSLSAATAGRAADDNIETGGNSVPVVPGLGMAIGRDPLAATDGAGDLSALLPLGRCRFLAGGRNCRTRRHLSGASRRAKGAQECRKDEGREGPDHSGPPDLPTPKKHLQ